MKSNNVSMPVALGAIAISFFALVFFNNVLFDKARLDLTQGQIYTVSDGTKAVLADIEEPLNLYFFYSNKATEGMTTIRNYSSRVQSLLEEYERFGAGNINLQIIDPEPFSESEDLAAEYGLTAAPIGNLGDSIYLGLAGSNALDDTEVIAFFDPSQEQLLEYEISKLIYRLANPEPVKVAVLSSLPVAGGLNPNPMAMQMGQQQTLPEWAVLTQLKQLYQVEVLNSDVESVPTDIETLILIHPKDLSPAQRYAIDQFVMAGGKLLAFIDPYAESDNQAAMMGMAQASVSDLPGVLSAWGVDYDQQIVLDAAKGLEIRMPSGLPGRHMGYIGLDQDTIDPTNVVTASLSSINGASFGHFTVAENATTQFSPMLFSSQQSKLTDGSSYSMAMQNPEVLAQGFASTGIAYALAGKLTGPAQSSFEQPPEGYQTDAHIASAENIQVILVADTDILTDRLWVQAANFFGQTILQPFANNGDFVINAVDHLAGSTELMSVRGKGVYQRPFEVVESLAVEAEAKFREQEERLQAQLEQTEMQLAQLQSQQGDAGALVLSAEQEQAIEQFMEQKLQIRKELREVRHQLDKDIERLGTWVKVLNIAVFPLLLTFFLALVAGLKKRRLLAQYQGGE